jgi:hypothetical protein
MAAYTLSNFYLGENDGKKEAVYRADFEKYFFDYNNIYQQALKPQTFIILGKKGSGKTILAEYITKVSKDDPLCFYTINSYKDFKFHELINLKSTDISPNEYISIWEWVILLDLARECLKDQGIPNDILKKKLETFFKDNYTSIDIDSQKIIDITKEKKIKGELLKIGAEISQKTTISQGIYLHYLEDLRRVVFELLKRSNSKYLVFYDELDDKFRNDDYYKDTIISLIKAAERINISLLKKGISGKIVILMRTDIFSLLNDPDLNKIRIDNALLIDWGNKVDKNSPLFEMILTKLKCSVPALANASNSSLFNQIFPQDIKNILPERYMLERTLFRPRDLITMLNFIIKKYPYSSYFGWKGFVEVQADYSAYFFQEIRNELCGHMKEDEINDATLMLKQFNYHFFSYQEIKAYYSAHKTQFPSIDLENALRIFFKFNIIGNKWFNKFKGKEYYCWAHRDYKAELDFDKTMIVHLGLRRELSM